MMATSRTVIFATTFTIACAVVYTACTELNLPVVTYHPVSRELDLWWTPERRGPAMYWYGWMLTSLVAAIALALVASVTPERWLQHAIMFGVLVAIGYLVTSTAALFVYERATVELEFLKSRWLHAAVAVLVAAVLTCFAPVQWRERLWPAWTWLVPLGTLAVLGYYLTPYFTR